MEEQQRLVEHILLRMPQLMSLGRAHDWLALDLTMPQLKVLLLLYEGEKTMGQLAKSLGVTMSTVTGIVDRLVAEGLVARSESPLDRRQVVGRLTEKGHQLVERLHAAGQTAVSNMLERLTLEDLRTVGRALDILYSVALAQERASGSSDREPGASAGSFERHS